MSSVQQDMLQQRALRVEELLAKYDPPPEEKVGAFKVDMDLSLEAPNIGWEAEYLQGPL